jgi:hypothetical protein
MVGGFPNEDPFGRCEEDDRAIPGFDSCANGFGCGKRVMRVLIQNDRTEGKVPAVVCE